MLILTGTYCLNYKELFLTTQMQIDLGNYLVNYWIYSLFKHKRFEPILWVSSSGGT